MPAAAYVAVAVTVPAFTLSEYVTAVVVLSPPGPVVAAEHGVMAALVYGKRVPVHETVVVVVAAVMANVALPLAGP